MRSYKKSMDVNKVILIGNVAKEPESKELATGKNVTKVRLATNHRYKDGKSGETKVKADFHNIVGWNNLGKNMAKFLKKGDKVYFEGRINNNTWEGKDGVKKYFTDIVANQMVMLGSAAKKGDMKKRAEAAEIVEEQPTEIPF